MPRHMKPVDRLKISRRVYHSPLEEIARDSGWLVMGVAAALVCGVIWQASLWVSLPALIIWFTAFLSADFRMPLRMPTDMNRPDPSTERQSPGKMLGFLPVTAMRRTVSQAAGILYCGYERAFDAGRELWLSMDDLTRHLILMATTGAGKTEMLLGYVLNALCWAKGLIFSDGKAQNDVWFAIASLALRFGREDDLRVINFITGGHSRAQRLLDNDKSRPQSNTLNPFALNQETYIIQLMDSMLPPSGNDGGWQEKARAMNQALQIALVYKCRREGLVMSQRVIQEYLPLRKMAELYLQAEAEEWHEEARLPLKNYLSTLAGFDMALVSTPSEWTAEPLNQHGYLIQQYTRMLSLFSDTYGHIFSRGAGDVDLRDVVHNDRILGVLIPALELSATEASTLGRLVVSQLAMILSQDLGEKIEGKADDILVIKKFKDRFPFLWIADEIGAYYTEVFGHLATQVRSLGYALVLAGQDLQRLKSAAGDKIWTLIGNMFTRIAGTITDPRETLEMYQRSGGSEVEAVQDTLHRKASLFGGSTYQDADRVSLRESQRIKVDEVQALDKGEQITLFQGRVVRGASLYIEDSDKTTRGDIRINRFIEVTPPALSALMAYVPGTVRRTFPRKEAVTRLLFAGKTDKQGKRSRQHPDNLIITDGALFALAEDAVLCDEIEEVPPTPVERAARMFSLASAMLRQTRGHYGVEIPEPASITVNQEQLDKYQRYHQSAVTEKSSDGFIGQPAFQASSPMY